MTENWYINNNSKEVIDKNLQTLKTTDKLADEETSPIKERVIRIEDKIKDLTKERSTIESVRDVINDRLKEMVEKQNNKEVSSSVQIICKKLDTERQKSLIETSKKENSTLEQSLRGKLIDNDNNSLTNSKVTDRAISITYKGKEKDELKKETSLIGIIHEEKKKTKY